VQLCLSVLRQFDSQGLIYSALYVLLPTSPFRRSETLHQAWRAFLDSGADTLLSVVPLEHPPQWALMKAGGWLRPVFPKSYELSRQTLAQAYRHDGGHAIARIEKLLQTKSFLNSRTLPFPVAPEEAMDIDEPEDLARAEYLLGERQRKWEGTHGEQDDLSRSRTSR
jgi:CMP-N,N'-diacetyllegionaminic acid synthase